MSCACAHVPEGATEGVFSVDASSLTFGRGAIAEIGELAKSLGVRRVGLFTDRGVAKLEIFERARQALASAGIDVGVYDEVRVEPTDASFLAAARFASEGKFDGYVSVGGGSSIDTCKAALLSATFPGDLMTWFNRPVGAGTPIPGPLPPHIACPTTSGTGSELTGIAVCDVLALHAKTGIASRRLRPTLAVIDPDATDTLPASVVAASGFDVLCHALESFTARPFSSRPLSIDPLQRPMSQGQNPWSDLGSREALRLGAKYLVRAVNDATDTAAREQIMWAATLAGLAFGNAGVHLPHAMAYAVAGQVKEFRMPGYPDAEPMVPHGISVVASAPEAFRFTAPAGAPRHLESAVLLGASPDVLHDAAPTAAGDVLAGALERLMKDAHVPVGLRALGYVAADVSALVAGTIVQKRLLDNAPCPIAEADLDAVFRAAVSRA
jgi:hydroxyacid-oxoacid transhydrogenase